MFSDTIPRPLAIAAGVVVLLAVSASHGGALSVSAERVEAAPGAEVEMPIAVRGAAGMEGLQFVLMFDPSVIEAATVELAPLAGAGMIDVKVREPGTLRVAMFPEATIEEDGVLLVARFDVGAEVEAGTATAVEIADVRAWEVREAFPVEMLASAEPGLLTVVGPAAAPAWVWPVGVAAALVIVLAVAWRLRPGHVRAPH